jgi:hypothetical protein
MGCFDDEYYCILLGYYTYNIIHIIYICIIIYTVYRPIQPDILIGATNHIPILVKSWDMLFHNYPDSHGKNNSGIRNRVGIE